MTKRRAYTYRKPRKGSATSLESKARSLQGAYRAATDRTRTLTMADARTIVNEPPACPYCQQPIPYQRLSIDHMEPRSRGGSSEPENLIYCDQRCNQAKGNLTAAEFTALMAFLKDWPVMRESVLTRLIAGGAAWGRRSRRRRS